jgi:hypothetical protein
VILHYQRVHPHITPPVHDEEENMDNLLHVRYSDKHKYLYFGSGTLLIYIAFFTNKDSHDQLAKVKHNSKELIGT